MPVDITLKSESLESLLSDLTAAIKENTETTKKLMEQLNKPKKKSTRKTKKESTTTEKEKSESSESGEFKAKIADENPTTPTTDQPASAPAEPAPVEEAPKEASKDKASTETPVAAEPALVEETPKAESSKPDKTSAKTEELPVDDPTETPFPDEKKAESEKSTPKKAKTELTIDQKLSQQTDKIVHMWDDSTGCTVVKHALAKYGVTGIRELPENEKENFLKYLIETEKILKDTLKKKKGV